MLLRGFPPVKFFLTDTVVKVEIAKQYYLDCCGRIKRRGKV